MSRPPPHPPHARKTATGTRLASSSTTTPCVEKGSVEERKKPGVDPIPPSPPMVVTLAQDPAAAAAPLFSSPPPSLHVPPSLSSTHLVPVSSSSTVTATSPVLLLDVKRRTLIDIYQNLLRETMADVTRPPHVTWEYQAAASRRLGRIQRILVGRPISSLAASSQILADMDRLFSA